MAASFILARSVLQWLERPSPAYRPGAHRHVRRVYTEDPLDYGIARMVTPKPRVSREAARAKVH